MLVSFTTTATRSPSSRANTNRRPGGVPGAFRKALHGVKAGDQPTTRWTLPALMQDVQTFSLVGVPLMSARTGWMLGLNRRGVRALTRRIIAPLPKRATLLPNVGCLPQTSHFLDMILRVQGRDTDRPCYMGVSEPPIRLRLGFRT